MKFLSIYTPDPKTASVPPTQEHMAEMGRLVEESRKAGVLVSTGMFLPDTNGGIRVQRFGSEISVSAKPGPLADAASRRAGFAVLEAKSREGAIDAARDFLRVAGDGECELTPVSVGEPARSLAAPIAWIFSFNDEFMLQALEGLTQEELWRAPTDRNNSMLWVAGHVVQTRVAVLQMLGERVETGWGNLFDRGAGVREASQYPSGAEIERVMREVSPRLRAAILALSDEDLSRAASLPIPGVKTLADGLAFFASHDSYHLGQMAYIRKSLGYPGLAG